MEARNCCEGDSGEPAWEHLVDWGFMGEAVGEIGGLGCSLEGLWGELRGGSGA